MSARYTPCGLLPLLSFLIGAPVRSVDCCDASMPNQQDRRWRSLRKFAGARRCWLHAAPVGLGEKQTGMGSCDLLLTTRALLNGGLPLPLGCSGQCRQQALLLCLLHFSPWQLRHVGQMLGSPAGKFIRILHHEFERHGCPLRAFASCMGASWSGGAGGGVRPPFMRAGLADAGYGAPLLVVAEHHALAQTVGSPGKAPPAAHAPHAQPCISPAPFTASLPSHSTAAALSEITATAECPRPLCRPADRPNCTAVRHMALPQTYNALF